MPFFIKSSSNGDWPTVKKFFVKSSTSGNWPTVKRAFVKSVSGWTQFWPKSGPYATTSPYFSTDQSGNTAVSGPTVLYGSTIYGQRGTWVGNGGTISSYTYKLESSTSSEVGSGPYTSILSETTMSTTYQQLVLNTSQYDGKYLIFTVKATRSDGVSGSDSTDSSGTRLAVIRNAPVKKTFTDASISSTSTSLPVTLNYLSQWNGTSAYLPDSSRSSVKWYTASSGTYTAENIATYGTLVTTGITTNTPTNDGTTYTVTSTLVTPSSVPSGTYYYAVDSQFNSNTDYYNTTSGIQQYDVYGPIAFPPTPIGQSPSITGSTTVGNLASFNIGSWTNSPTSYAWRIYYNYNLVSGVLTYPAAKTVTNKTLFGFSAALRTSSNHNYKVNDKVIITGMDALFNKAAPGYTISTVNGDILGFTIDAPTAYYVTDPYTSGSFVSYNGNAYRAVSSLSAGTNFSITAAYSVGANISFLGLRYVCLSTLVEPTAWFSTSSYSSGQNVYYNSNRYIATSNIPANSSAPGINPSWLNVMPNNTSYWANAEPTNSAYWTLQSFSSQATSGTVTAPNYYEGTTTTPDSFPLIIPTTDYKSGYDLRNQELGIGVRAYNEIATSPQEYQAEKTVYGYPVITINSITPLSTTASLAYTASYMDSYYINVTTSATVTNVSGGASQVTYFANNSFDAGQSVTISGVNPSQYNITATIASATATSFTINTNITGAYVSGGSAVSTPPTYPKTVVTTSSPITITNLKESTLYNLSISPINGEGVYGTTQSTSFTTTAQPTISNISLVNTLAPAAATLNSFSSNSSNVGTVTWTNGAGSSSAWLKSVSGSGSLSTQSDPGSLNTSGTFTIISTGTANATVSAINKGKSVYVRWNQTKAASFLISYRIGTAPSDVVLGNTTDAIPEVLIYGPVIGTASQVTINSVTVYNLPNQQGPSAILSSGATLTPTNAQTDTVLSGNVTYTVPQVAPSGGTASVDPTTGIAGSTTFTASTSGWSGTTPITYTYSWQWMNTFGQWTAVATGTTFTPTIQQNATAAAWRVVVTATNAVGSATANASFTVNSPVIPTITMGANTGVTQTTGTINWTSTGQNSWSSTGTFSGSGNPDTSTRSVSKIGLTENTLYTGTVTVTSSTGNTASANYSLTTSAGFQPVVWGAMTSPAFQRTNASSTLRWGWNNQLPTSGDYTASNITWEWQYSSSNATTTQSATPIGLISSGTRPNRSAGGLTVGASTYNNRVSSLSGDYTVGGTNPAGVNEPITFSTANRYLRYRAVVVGSNGTTYRSNYSAWV